MLLVKTNWRRIGGWLLVAAVAALPISCAARSSAKRFSYPEAKRTGVVDDYHGTKVADPFRWLEQVPEEDPAVKGWIEAENKITFDYLGRIPEREQIKSRMTALWNFERYGLPDKRGGRYVFTKNDGLQNQSVFYTMRTLNEEPKLLIDPNQWSKDGTISIGAWDVSEDGKYFAYAVADSGSDWKEWKVRDIETGTDTKDHLRWIKWGDASWMKDGSGFFYTRYPEPREATKLQDQNYYHKLYFHRLGTPQSEDKLIYERPDHKDWGFSGNVTDDGKFLIIGASQGTDPRNMVFYKDLMVSDAKVVELINEFEAEYDFIDNDGPIFWFQTDNQAPRRRVIAVDTRDPARANWKEIIPESKDTLQSTNLTGDHFVATYLKDAASQVKVFNRSGKPVRDVTLPGLGTAFGFGGRKDDPETFYFYTSYNVPGTVYRYDVTTGKSTVFKEPKVGFNPAEYETRQVFFSSKDGTKVPMFITHKKGLKLDGNNPTLLYGYGGFNSSVTPGFGVTSLVWMERGGVYAVANLRGGGEYGKAWHDGGRKLKKQNVFDDFIAAAEWLVANKYTRPEKLAIRGGSNGGLLVGACITQRPELFGVALPAVGVMDMLRFHKFTIGWAWQSDYGSPDNPEEFQALYAYSPLHNIKPGTKYPATLITTADHDDRVVPGHSFKFAAALQAAQAGSDPTLIRIQTKAGHGAGKPTSMRIEEESDILAFAIDNMR